MEAVASSVSRKLGSYADFKSGKYANKEFVFVLNHINENPSYKSARGVGRHFPPSVRMPLYDEIFDAEKGIQRVIRYIPGEKSIYMDEQTSDEKIPKKPYYLEFIDGDKRIDGKQTLLIKYLMTTNKNGSNLERDKTAKIKFFTVDPGQGLQSVMDADEMLSEAQHFCYKGDWDEVAAYAMVCGIPLDSDPREIRYALRLRATADPKKFMDGLKSPKMKRKYFTMEALKMGIIEKNMSTNTINWKAGNAITQAPMGKDLVDDFVDATFTPNGEKVWDAIMGMMRPEKKVPSIKTELQNTPSEPEMNQIASDLKPVIPQVIVADVSDEDLSRYIESGVTKGVIIFSKPFWYKYNEKNHKLPDLMMELKTNPVLLAKLKSEIF